MLQDLFKQFKRGDLDIKKVPDATVIGEEGIDAKGLTKELFTLVMNALTSGNDIRRRKRPPGASHQ